MNGTSETVLLACKGCGKEIIRPEGKLGRLVECSRCHTVNRTPGIAMQAQATELQLARIQRTLRTFRVALWLPFCAIIPLAILAVLSGLEWVGYLVELGLVVFLFFCMAEARGFLGRSRGAAFFFFVVLGPVWWVITFLTYFRFKRRVSVLVLNGARPTSAHAAEQHSAS